MNLVTENYNAVVYYVVNNCNNKHT